MTKERNYLDCCVSGKPANDLRQRKFMNIDKEFDAFFDFDTEDKSQVTSVSAKLFAQHCVYDLLAANQVMRDALQKMVGWTSKKIQQAMVNEALLDAGSSNIVKAGTVTVHEIEDWSEVNLNYDVLTDGTYQLYVIQTKSNTE